MRKVEDLTVSRRHLLGLAAGAAAGSLAAPALAAAPPRPPAPGLKIGLASYSLRKLSLDKALEVCKEANVKYLTIKEMHLPLKDPPEKLKAAVEQIKAAGITLLGGGVIYMGPKD